MSNDPTRNSKESTRWKVQEELRKIPNNKGWFVISYTSILLALVITAFFTSVLNLEKDSIIAFSTIEIEIFIILLVTFLGGYFALITFIEPKTTKKTTKKTIQENEFSGIYSTVQILKEMKYPMIIPALIVILLSIILIFFYSPLSINPLYKTFVALIILEISIIAGWFFVRFMTRFAFLVENIIGGNL